MEVDKKNKDTKRKLDVAGFEEEVSGSNSEGEEEEMQVIMIGQQFFKETVEAWCEKNALKVIQGTLQNKSKNSCRSEATKGNSAPKTQK